MPPIPRQFLIILAIAALIYVAVDFSRRIQTLAQLSQTERRLEVQVSDLEEQQRELKQLLSLVMRPEFAEKIAREIYHWAREGDNVVITQKVYAPAAPPAPAVALPPEKSWWDRLLDILLGP